MANFDGRKRLPLDDVFPVKDQIEFLRSRSELETDALAKDLTKEVDILNLYVTRSPQSVMDEFEEYKKDRMSEHSICQYCAQHARNNFNTQDVVKFSE